MTAPHEPRSGKARTGPLWALLHGVSRVTHLVVLLAAAGTLVGSVVLFVCAAPHRKHPPLPPTMEEVDWHDPQSSVYCLACHRQVAPAMAGLDVQRGHSQNVPLNETQLAAVREMGTVAGPNGTLICMSCHKLGRDSSPYMLADTLAGSRLCQRCHLGHYAQGTPHDLRQSAPQEKNRLGQTVAQGGPCSACHLSHRYAREIIPSPLDPDGYCITCHQAYHVAAGHARTKMEHPESHCLQCHNPHDASNGNFLRAPDNELCLRCHTDLGGGVAAGMHPLGPTNQFIPAELCGDALAPAAESSEIRCVTCHLIHEAGYPYLLRMSPTSNQLCLTCHGELLASESSHGALPGHGQTPVLNSAQRAVVAKWGAPTGPGAELLCVSCHRVHGARASASLLVEQSSKEEMCLACHPQKLDVVGSPHDLRTNHPLEQNIQGATVLAAGSCSACHLAHGPARAPAPSAGDPQGQCLNCHQNGQCASQKRPGAVNHPKTACTECHNPHERQSGNFLVQNGAALCQRCHADHATMAGGPHDLTVSTHPEKWPAEARSQPGPCLPCHVPHGDAPSDLFRFRKPTGFGNHDGVCMACHRDTAWEADTTVPAVHPRKIAPDQDKVDVALVPIDVRGDKRIGCRTCHNAHGGAEPVHLARVGAGEATEDLCLHCHAEKRLVRYTGHSAEKLAAAGYTTDSCKPCHAMHASRSGTWGQLLSPRFLPSLGNSFDATTLQNMPCGQCHRATGAAPTRTFSQHPDILTLNVYQPGELAYMPLFGPDGQVDPEGQVTCRTCHFSHGRTDVLRLIDERRELTPSERNALKAQVRPFERDNICIICHGESARFLFLYFHEPDRRPPARPVLPPLAGPAMNAGG